MERVALRIIYRGRVQGVGFRYTVKSLVPGYEVAGEVRNLADGTVELRVQGTRDEVEAFRQGVRDSEVGRFINEEEAVAEPVRDGVRGFEILR
jgi:acylphosphatase